MNKQRISNGYRVKSSDGLYVVRTTSDTRPFGLKSVEYKTLTMSKANALRLMADWLDCGYLPKLVHVYKIPKGFSKTCKVCGTKLCKG